MAITPIEVAMTELLVAVATFLCLIGAAWAGNFARRRLAAPSLPESAIEILGLTANIFLVTTSVVLGLLLNSAKTTLETNTRNVHAVATELIVLDRTLRGLGPEAEETRRRLTKYVQIALEERHILEADPPAEAALNSVGSSLMSIRPPDAQTLAEWNDARQIYRQVVRQRWVEVDGPEGAVPTPLVAMLIIWLSVIFASLGFRAPRGPVVATTFAVAALLLSGTLYLILDMDTPVSGLLIEVSNTPFQRALTAIQRPLLAP